MSKETKDKAYLSMRDLPEDVRAKIAKIVDRSLAKAKGRRSTTVATITSNQLRAARGLVESGTLGRSTAFMGTMTYSFSKTMLKWFHDEPEARALAQRYLEKLRANGAANGVRPTSQVYGQYYCDEDGCKHPGPFTVPQAVGTHKRMAHGTFGKTNPINAKTKTTDEPREVA